MNNRVVVFKEFSEEAKALSARLIFPLKVGDVILRPVIYYQTNTERLGTVMLPQVLTPKLIKNDRGQIVIKVQKWNTAGGRWVGLDSNKSGIVAFCSEPVGDLWTHFEVTSVGAKGKCAFVKPVYGEETALIANFKRRES